MALFGGGLLGQQQPGLLGGQQPVLPRVPWNQNPMITMAGMSLLGGRNLNEGLSNVAANAPAGMAAKSGMQQFMLAQQERDRERSEADARKAQMNEVMKAWPGLSPEQRALFSAQPELFGQYAAGTMTPPKPTDDISEYNFAKSQGFSGTFEDWQISQKKAGATTVDARQMGTIPPGYKANYDDKGNIVSMSPIAGGPEDTTRQDALKREKTETKADIVVQDIDRTLETVKRIPTATTGIGGMILQNVPGTGASNVASLLNTVKANVGFDQLQAMRDSSPTGGALGQVSQQENVLLQSVLGSVEQSQSQEQLEFNLKRLKNVYLDIIHGPGNGPPRESLEGAGPGGSDGWTEIEPGVRIREKP